MSFDRKSPRIGYKRRISRVLGTFELLQSCNSQQGAVTLPEMTSCDLRLPEVTRKWLIWPEVAWKLLYKAEKWRMLHISPPTRLYLAGGGHVMGNDVTWPQLTGRTSFDRKSPGGGCRGPETGIYCTFHFLQGCSSQEEAVTWQEMTSRDLRWRRWPWSDIVLTGSHLEWL